MSESTVTEVYVPNEDDIDAVLSQLSDDVSRDVIGDLLVKTAGDVTEAVLQILTNDNVIPKNMTPQRNTPHAEIDQWNEFYKDLDKYNIEQNIDRVKKPLQLQPHEFSAPGSFNTSGDGPGAAGSYGAGFDDMFNMKSIIPPKPSQSDSDIKLCTE